MSLNHMGNSQPAIDREEHGHVGGIDNGAPGKKVIVLGTDGNQANISTDDSILLLRRIVKILESNAVVDVNNRQKVTIDNITNGLGALLGVAIATSAAGVPGVNYPTPLAPIQNPTSGSWQPVWIGPVDQRFQIMDAARLNYNESIRSHMTFT